MYPPLCSVLFSVREVFGGASQDTLSVDLHEDWLAPARDRRAERRRVLSVHALRLQCLRPGRKSVFCTATVRHCPSSLRTTRVPMLVRSFSSMSP